MQPETKKPKLSWVDNVDGKPRVRWMTILIYASVLAILQLAIFAGMNWLLKAPMRWAMPLIMLFASLAGLTCLVELQRQAIFAGRPRFRLGFAASLILITFIGGFFATLGNELRYSQHALAANQKLKGELEVIMDGGNAYIGSLDGRNITCNVTRKSFSDEDLRKLIDRTSQQSSYQCEISSLFIESSAITDRGLAQLSACENLEFLTLPTQTLGDEMIMAIGKCQKLKHLFLDEKKLSAKQLAHLEQALPKVQLNGKTWKIRAAGK